MHAVIRQLTATLDGDVRAVIKMRAEGLFRGVRYEMERQSKTFLAARKAGWSIERIEILCNLNAFYHVVIGPLASASRSDLQAGLIRDIPVSHGSTLKVTYVDALLLKECHNHFSAVMKELGIDFWVLQSSHAQDLLYTLGKPRKIDG